MFLEHINTFYKQLRDRLCGLVLRVPGYRFRDPGFDSRSYIFWEVVGLGRGPLSLVSTTEELLGSNSSGSGLLNLENQIFWEVVSLERGPLSLVSTTEELLGRNSSGSVLENWKSGRGDTLSWPRDTFYPQTLALTSPTSGGRSVGIVHSRTKATEFSFISNKLFNLNFNTYPSHEEPDMIQLEGKHCTKFS
jgi:hypothetical protein